jgi:hypothetical protein
MSPGRATPPPAGTLPAPQQPRIPVQGQTLITIVNDPRVDAKSSWFGFGRAADPLTALGSSNWAQPPPPLDPLRYPHYTRRDLGAYLGIVHTAHAEFVHERESLAEMSARQLLLGVAGPDVAGGAPSHASREQRAAHIEAGEGPPKG